MCVMMERVEKKKNLRASWHFISHSSASASVPARKKDQQRGNFRKKEQIEEIDDYRRRSFSSEIELENM